MATTKERNSSHSASSCRFSSLDWFAARAATVNRGTKETKVDVSINLDGTGVCNANSQIPFLDHMLDVSQCLNLSDQSQYSPHQVSTALVIWLELKRCTKVHKAAPVARLYPVIIRESLTTSDGLL